MQKLQRLHILACGALEDEVRFLSQGLSHVVALEIIELNLHETPQLLKKTLQEKIDNVDQNYSPQAIALVYGLCGCGLVGIESRQATLVVPRAHDCVTLFLGSKDRYANIIKSQPETYWYTPKWNSSGRAPSMEKIEKMKIELSKKFDEEEVVYLIEQELQSLQLYKNGAYIDLGVEPSQENENYAAQCAKSLGWNFQRHAGDGQLIADLLAGNWDEKRFFGRNSRA